MAVSSVKLDDDLKERIKHLAAARRRTPHWIVREALEAWEEYQLHRPASDRRGGRRLACQASSW